MTSDSSSPLARYEREVSSGQLQPDDEQRAVMQHLDQMAADLTRRRAWTKPSSSVFASWFKPTSPEIHGVPGLYLWGGVGRGKTHLCDLFFDSLTFKDKTRLHFHRFMQRIHDDLRTLEGVEDPLEEIADKWAMKARLLLLDEIHVNDITDAMLLGGLLTALFKRGITLVTTSNVPPSGLYRDGLQRARFLPAIAQIQNHTTVREMVGDTDFRMRLMQTEPIYLLSEFSDGHADAETAQQMQDHFNRLRSDGACSSDVITINERSIPVRERAGDVIWFDYETLCNTPRSTQDYIEIASEFQTVLISDIPRLGESNTDEARRFVNLIDEFYDRRVKLIVSAEALPDDLYNGERLAFEFVRAASRLTEMQSREYLGLDHGVVPGKT